MATANLQVFVIAYMSIALSQTPSHCDHVTTFFPSVIFLALIAIFFYLLMQHQLNDV